VKNRRWKDNNETAFKEMGFGRKWWVITAVVLHLWILLPESKMDF
jgi:hypothetical protein